MAAVTTAYAGSGWVARAVGDGRVSALGRAAADILGDVFEGIYHLPHVLEVDWADGEMITVPIWTPIASYDNDQLTRLVVLAHERAMRVEIRPRLAWVGFSVSDSEGGSLRESEGDDTVPFAVVEVCFSRREREGTSIFDRHPTIEAAVARIRGDLATR